MPVTIGELTAEVIAEADARRTASVPPPNDEHNDIATVRAGLLAIARQALRTCAEDFDD
jgi:hypothetical protein